MFMSHQAISSSRRRCCWHYKIAKWLLQLTIKWILLIKFHQNRVKNSFLISKRRRIPNHPVFSEELVRKPVADQLFWCDKLKCILVLHIKLQRNKWKIKGSFSAFCCAWLSWICHICLSEFFFKKKHLMYEANRKKKKAFDMHYSSTRYGKDLSTHE